MLINVQSPNMSAESQSGWGRNSLKLERWIKSHLCLLRRPRRIFQPTTWISQRPSLYALKQSILNSNFRLIRMKLKERVGHSKQSQTSRARKSCHTSKLFFEMNRRFCQPITDEGEQNYMMQRHNLTTGKPQTQPRVSEILLLKSIDKEPCEYVLRRLSAWCTFIGRQI